MSMSLYRAALPIPEIMIVAGNTRQACKIFMAHAASSGFFTPGKLVIELENATDADRRMPGLHLLLDEGAPGVAKFTTVGWLLTPH
jgi:hypothetical protein